MRCGAVPKDEKAAAPISRGKVPSLPMAMGPWPPPRPWTPPKETGPQKDTGLCGVAYLLSLAPGTMDTRDYQVGRVIKGLLLGLHLQACFAQEGIDDEPPSPTRPVGKMRVPTDSTFRSTAGCAQRAKKILIDMFLAPHGKSRTMPREIFRFCMTLAAPLPPGWRRRKVQPGSHRSGQATFFLLTL